MRNLKMNHHKKIAPKWEGPFGIEEVLGPVTYWLKLLTTWKIHNVFHAILLWPYIKNKVYGNNYPRLLPELLEGEEVHEVETILKHQQRERGYQYYVKWKGYLLQLMNNKEDQLSVLVFSTEQVNLLKFDSQVVPLVNCNVWLSELAHIALLSK